MTSMVKKNYTEVVPTWHDFSSFFCI